MKQINKHQQGFTLLELLVVITLLATLSVGALVAYEGVGDNAQTTSTASNTLATENAIRNYRQIEGLYPNQWDNLSIRTSGSPITTLAAVTKQAFGNFDVSTAASATNAIYNALEDVGVAELQNVDTVATGVSPNLAHNEGANTGAVEDDTDNVNNISIVPAGTGCTVGGAATIAEDYDATTTVSKATASRNLNKINDALATDTCHLVVALGFGHDAAHSTFGKKVSIGSAPSFNSKDINPASNYARYVALFYLGSAADSATNNITDTDIKAKALLIGLIGPDGKSLDEVQAAANATN